MHARMKINIIFVLLIKNNLSCQNLLKEVNGGRE